MVKGTGMDTDKDFVGAEMRLTDIGIVKNTWVTVLVDDDGFHERPPGTRSERKVCPADISYHDMLEVPDRDALYGEVTLVQGGCPDGEN